MKQVVNYSFLMNLFFIGIVQAQDFIHLPEEHRVKLLEKPQRGVSVVLDTDTYNEIDDQFALVYALLSPESFKLEAIYAAPFVNHRSDNPSQGMERSYEEILRILNKMNRKANSVAYKGSRNYVPSDLKPERSDATDDLIQRALKHSPDDPLYVVAVGAITNVGNAILLEPKITRNIVVVWVGGNAPWWPHTREFNMRQDKAAANVVLDSGVAFVQFPAWGVVSEHRTTVPEMEYYLRGHNEISDYLLDIFVEYQKDDVAWSKVLWDMTTVAYLVDNRWTPSQLAHAPRITEQDSYYENNSRHLIRRVYRINRDAIFKDFFQKVQAYDK